MFKKKLIASLFLAMTGLVLFAQNATKIGVVNGDLVIQNSQKGKKFFADLKTFTDKKGAELNTSYEEFEAKKKDMQTKAASMSEDKRRKALADLKTLETAIKRMQEDAKREHDLMLNTALGKMGKEIIPVIRQVAQELDVDIVINHGQESQLVYYSEKVDITAAVIKKFDELSK